MITFNVANSLGAFFNQIFKLFNISITSSVVRKSNDLVIFGVIDLGWRKNLANNH